MPRSEILNTFLTGTPPRTIRMLAAKALVPLLADEATQLLVHLLADSDQEISAQAGDTLRGLPESEILDCVTFADCDPAVLDYFASSGASAAICEAIIQNPRTSGSTVSRLALSVPAPILDIILDNRVRLLESPEILANLKLNPHLTPSVRRLVQEIETEFFSSKKSEYRLEGPAEETPPQAGEAPFSEAGVIPEDLTLEGLPIDPEAREQAILERLAKMSVRDKIKLALMGTREERGILVRDANREISRAVLKSPKLSDNEVESFAAMRNIPDEILREIGSNREWIKRYNVIHNLVRNPRTPPLVAQRLVARLLAKDLMLLSRDRGVPELVRRSAQRVLGQRVAR